MQDKPPDDAGHSALFKKPGFLAPGFFVRVGQKIDWLEMTDNQKSKIDKLLKDIEASRVKKSEYLKEKNIDPKTSKTIRLALRLSVEIIASLLVGVFMGLLIDHFFDTYPLGFILMFILGAAAGIWNVFKTMGLLETATDKNIDKDVDKKV